MVFSNFDKKFFLETYLKGIQEGWDTDSWRMAIDTAMKGHLT
jgi:hypothetical protein